MIVASARTPQAGPPALRDIRNIRGLIQLRFLQLRVGARCC
jgi:hypothetical protein